MNEIESLGKYLRKERETRKVSLKEVAKNIKVREQFLKAVEEDRHDLLPPPTYVKGFLSAYAKYLGVDPNELVFRYETFLKGGAATCEEIPPEKRISWNKKYIWIIGGVIIAGLIAFALVFLSPSKQPMKPSLPKPATEEMPAPPPPPVPKEAESLPVPEEKPILVQLKAVEKTWISIQLDDQPLRDILLQPGESISYRAMNRIEMILGNAGGLDLIFNGKKLERFGNSGEVFTVIFTPQGVEAQRREQPNLPEE